MTDANQMWLTMLSELLKAAVVAPRGRSTRELLGYKSVVSMTNPVVTVSERMLGYRFMCAEAAWIISGDNRVETISPYSKAIADFSDDGYMFFGAYGPKIVQQFPYIIKSLRADEQTRQAVICIWRESPMQSKDIPCTVTLQWLIRDGVLDCFANMRSSDAWLGIPYDWFNFSMVSAYLLLILRKLDKRFAELKLGNLHLYAASQHLYEHNWSAAHRISEEFCVCRHIADLNPDDFDGPEDFHKHLWLFADQKETTHNFMKELHK